VAHSLKKIIARNVDNKTAKADSRSIIFLLILYPIICTMTALSGRALNVYLCIREGYQENI